MVNWLKQISAPSVTTSDIFAGDVLNWLIQYHNDVDLGAGDPAGVVHILTETVFNSGRLKWFDSNKSHTVTVGIPDYVENKVITLPSTLGPADEFVFEDAIATMINKTLSYNLNVLKHSTTNAAGDLLRGDGTQLVRLARGTANQILTVNGGGTDIAWQTPAPINQLTFLPDVANVGNTWGIWAGGAREGTGIFSGCTLLNSGSFNAFQGTNTSWQPTTEFVSGTTTAIVGGFQGFAPTAGGWYTARNQNFRFKIKLQFDVLTDKRFFVGLVGVDSLPTGVDTYIGTAVAGFGFRFSSTTDTTWQVLRNDTAGAAVVVNSGVTVAANTAHTLEIIADDANSRIGWSIDGSAVTYYTTDIPANVTPLNYFVHLGSKTAVAQKVRVHYAYLTQAAS